VSVYFEGEEKKPQYQEILLLFRVENGTLKKLFCVNVLANHEAKALLMAEGNVGM